MRDTYHGILAEEITDDPSYMRYINETYDRVEPDDANLFGSRVGDSRFHMPIFDIDYSANLVPSRTPGHFHLYLNKRTTWRKYKRVLKAMYKAGLIERGYYVMSKKRGQAFARLPGAR